MRRLLAFIAVLALVLAAAGCGGDEESSLGDSAASIAPANAAAYVSVNSDLDSDEWNELNSLLDRFPDKEKLTAALRDSLRKEGVELEDLQAALGPTVELVALGFEDADADLVGLTQPRDEQKLRELLESGGETWVLREIEGWTAFAESEATLDRFAEARGSESLADHDAFDQLMGQLPEQALAKAWLDTGRASEALAGFSGGGTGPLPMSAGTPVALAAALEAEEDGARFVAHFLNEDVGFEGADYGALVEEVPADAFAFFNTHGQDGRLKVTEQLRNLPGGAGFELEDVERMLGVTLEDVSTLFNQESVLWVRPGLGIPEVTLVLEVENEAQARTTVDKLVASAGLLGDDVETRPRTVAGVPATEIDLGEFAILYATVDGRLVLTSQASGIEALAEDGDRLVDEDRYKESVEAAGVPDGENVALWIDLEQALGLVETLAALGDEPLPPDVRANLDPLRAVVFSVSTSFEEGSMRFFLHVR
jgi:hypothetical protein